MDDDIQGLFAQAECSGQICVQSMDGTRELAIDADKPAVPASVFKVLVALTAEAAFAAGTLDPRERITLPGGNPTPGPVGFSLYRDDVEVSLRDLVVPLLTISDNVATDALLRRIGIDAVNEYGLALDLENTVIVSDLRATIDSIGQETGFRNWNSMSAWVAQTEDQAAADELGDWMFSVSAVDPARTTRTTVRDMATLLRLIWTGQGAPPVACARVRELMAQQVTKHRLTVAFPPPVRVAAKSGSLVGVVRNEVGVIEYPDGDNYVAAVFTQANAGTHNDGLVNAAIGQAAAAAVAQLRAMT
ncbi:MAG TPA: serine hydrolase [Trebonia sp.]|nr:serine hydrolase [Trebonia sp.]